MARTQKRTPLPSTRGDTGTGRRLQPGDLVLPGELFDEVTLDWVPYSGPALVIELLSPPLYPGPAHTIVFVLIEGRVVDDYFENELCVV